MFKECNVYYYLGLYMNEEEFNKLGLMKLEGSAFKFMLEKYDSIYSFVDYKIHEINKQVFMEMTSRSDNRFKEFCYQIRDGKFILFPINISYGIADCNGNLLSYYDKRIVRNIKLNLVKHEGISAIIDDMNEEKSQVVSFNRQQQLTKVRNALDYRN